MMGKRRRAVIRMDQENGPTPETKAKLRPDAIVTAYRAGLIDAAEMTAAVEIREVCEAVVCRLVRSPAGRLESAAAMSVSRHPLDGVSEPMHRRYMARYIPWAALGSTRGWLARVIDFAVDGVELDEQRALLVRIGLRAW